MSTPRRRQKIWIILPAYNEAADLGALLDRVDDAMFQANLDYQIVLIDDGSSDGTHQVAAEAATHYPMLIERHEINQGLGSTIRDGLLRAAAEADPSDVLVTLDADNTHTPDLIVRMVRMIREGHDVVIASRYQRGSVVRGVSLLRRFLSRAAGLFLRLVFPIPGVRDYTSGYRAYRAGVMQELIAASESRLTDQDGFQVMVDILLSLRNRCGLIFGEAPLILRYDFKDGSSKMNVGATITDTLKLVVRRRLSS